MRRKNKYTVFLVITLLAAITLVTGTSYAILKGTITSTREHVIKAGKITLELTEYYQNINNNISVKSDVEGLLQEETYKFTLKNIGSGAAKYSIKLVNEQTGSNILPNKYIKVGLEINGKEHGPMSLEDVKTIIDSGIINKNEIITFKLRLWLDKDKTSEISAYEGSNISLKLKAEAEQRLKNNLDSSGANAPVLSKNMIPVYFNEEDSTWRKADKKNQNLDYKWYDYNEKMWANSVTVTEANRSTYLNAELGTTIPMDDILTMQVWIPRYKYKIFNYNENGTTYVDPQEIEITFEEGKTSTGDIKCTDNIQGTSDGTINGTPPTSSETCVLKKTNEECNDATCNTKTYTHPAFTFGEEELKGIWVGKFETTGTISRITTKPDAQSLRSQNISTFAANIMNMKSANNTYGFSISDDTHMMKNMEWGAVAYLTQSKYGMCTDGTCKEINFNNSSGYYTGRSGGNVGGNTGINTVYTNQTSTTQYNTYGFYTYDGYLLNYDTNTKSSTRDLTKIASTTGNIYGIYDMSGGGYEDVMANIISFDGKTMMSGNNSSSRNSGYTGIIYEDGAYNSYAGTYNYPNSKYYDKYSFTTSGTDGRKLTKLGDAIKEVGAPYDDLGYAKDWYGDNSVYAYSSFPWFQRGNGSAFGAIAGIFSSSYTHGGGANGITHRLVLLPAES